MVQAWTGYIVIVAAVLAAIFILPRTSGWPEVVAGLACLFAAAMGLLIARYAE